MSGRRAGVLVVVAVVALAGATLLRLGWYTLVYGHGVHVDTFAQLAWLHRWADPAALPGDISCDYFRTFHLPPGLRAVYFALIRGAGLSILSAAMVVTVACFALTVGLLYLVGRAGGGRAGGLLTVAAAGGLAVVPQAFPFTPFLTMHTGLPRMFAAPVLLVVILGFTANRVWVTSLGLLAGVLIYPPALVVGAAAVGISGLFRDSVRAAVRYYLAHLPAVAACGVVVLTLFPPTTDPRFGRLFTFEEAVAIPEFRAPGAITATDPMLAGDGVATAAVVPWVRHFWPALAALGVLALVCRRLPDPVAQASGLCENNTGQRPVPPVPAPSGGGCGLLRALVAISGGAFVCVVASVVLWFRLYEPSRYWAYPLAAVSAPAVGAVLSQFLRRPPLIAGAVAAVVVLLLLEYQKERDAPFPPPTPPEAIRAALAESPPESLVAVYPGDGDWVAVEVARPILISRIALFPYHDRFHAEASARFVAVRDAVYATDWEPVRRLRDTYRVRYLLYSRVRFHPEPTFTGDLTGHAGVAHLAHLTRDLVAAGPNRPFVLKSPPPEAVAAADGDLILLDLDRLPAGR